MNSFEFNKIAGAVLGTALLVFGLHELAGIIYHPHAPEKPGFAVEVAEAERRRRRSPPPRPHPPPPLGTLLASADAAKGQTVFKACAACHDGCQGRPQQGGPEPVGHRRAAPTACMRASPILRPWRR